MNFKKKVSGSWTDTPHYIHNTSTDTITTLPADIYANAATATVGLKGNTTQSGTPTPDNPIQPSECGDKTGNLFDVLSLVNDMHLNNVTGLPVSYSGRIASPNPVDVTQYTSVTISYTTAASIKAMYSVFSNDDLVGRFTAISSGTVIDVSNADKMYVCFYDIWGENINTSSVSNIMLNSGSTPLPYEPYGIKIPISSGDVKTPVYLGEVESTRRIKKLVLTGQENWTMASNNTFRLGNTYALAVASKITSQCSHYQAITNRAALVGMTNRCVCVNSANGELWIRDTDYGSSTDFNTYLAAQYAAGTPVCVWYVLATEETAVVNEPLMKIGDYADSIRGISIPTTAGANSLDVDTTVAPSEVTANYSGWHPVSAAHERENGAWT